MNRAPGVSARVCNPTRRYAHLSPSRRSATLVDAMLGRVLPFATRSRYRYAMTAVGDKC